MANSKKINALHIIFAIVMLGVAVATALYFWDMDHLIVAGITLGVFLIALPLHRVLLVLLAVAGGNVLALNLLSAVFPKKFDFDLNLDKNILIIALGLTLACLLFWALSALRKKAEKKAQVEEVAVVEEIEEVEALEEKVEKKAEEKVEAPALQPAVWHHRQGFVIPFKFD